jgi:Carotenoid biosynthesis protein
LFFIFLRIRNSPRLDSPGRRARAWFASTFFLLLVPFLIIVFHKRHVLDHEELTMVFEASQFFWVALFVVQILASRGFHALVRFFGVTFIYGLILENAGIYMHFFFEPSFRVYLGGLPAPLCTMLGWSVVFYVTIALTEQLADWWPWLKAAAWRRALAATLLALSMDAQLDPLASMSGVFWRWNEALAPGFLGVPYINFAAWFGAFLPFSWFLFSITDRTDISEPRKNYELFLRVAWAAVLGGTICFGIMAILEGGFDGPSFQILRAFGERLHPY